MRFKILVILLPAIFLLLSLTYKYRESLSKLYIQHYINNKLSELDENINVEFDDFEIIRTDGYDVLFLKGISINLGQDQNVNIEETQLYFHLGFLFTKIKLIKALAKNIEINFQLDQEKKEIINREKKINNLFAAATLLDTELEIENLQFEDYFIMSGLAKIKKNGQKKVLSIRINQDNKSEVEIEIKQSDYDTIGIKLQSFSFDKDIFRKLAKKLINLEMPTNNFIMDGYAVINLNTASINGRIDNISGNINVEKFFEGADVTVANGRFNFEGTNEYFSLYNVDINIDNSHFSGSLKYNGKLYLEGKITDLPYIHILKYWSSTKGIKAKQWYKKNIKGGIIKSAELTLDTSSNYLNINNAYFDSVSAHILENNIELDITEASGILNFASGKLNISLESAKIYQTKIKDFSITIDDTQENLVTKIYGNGNDSVQNLLIIAVNVAKQQLDAIEKAINIYDLTGKGDVFVDLEIINDDVHTFKKKIDMHLSDVGLNNLYGALNLKDGNFTLSINDKEVFLTGSAFSDKKKLTLKVEDKFKDDILIKVAGQFNIDDFKKAKFLPKSNLINGNFSGDFNIIQTKDNRLKIDINGNLDASQDGILSLLGQQGDAKLSIQIDKTGDIINLKKLKASGAGLDILGSGKITNTWSEILFTSFKVKNTDLTLKYQLKNNQSEFLIKAKTLDLSKTIDFDLLSSNDQPGLYKISAEFAKIQLKNGLFLINTNLSLNKETGSFIGQFNDKSILNARYHKDIGIDLDVTSASTLLRALDITSSFVNGRLALHLDTKDKRNNDGFIIMEDFAIKNAPVLAQILSLASLFGTMSVLNGEGIYFNKFTSTFKYGEGIISFGESWFEGPSLGISTQGVISLPLDRFIVRGNVVPLYKINKLIWKVPVIGKIVTGSGKSRGVIAAEYSANKESGKFNVSVNTITALTPTLFRKFLDVFN